MTTTKAAPAREIAAGAEPRVLILGGGVAGLTAAMELRCRLGTQSPITLIADHAKLVLGPALVAVPFGRVPRSVHIGIAQTLQRHNIAFMRAHVSAINPEKRTVQAGGQEVPYDFLLIATGPGDPGDLPALSIHSEATAVKAGAALEAFLANPGSAVVGLARGASYAGAAYEFVLALDAALRRRGLRDQASITFVTPETHLGFLAVGYARARQLFEDLFANRGISVFTGSTIERVEADAVYLEGGTRLPSCFSMVIPAFGGADRGWQAAGITDDHGLVPVDAQYRSHTYPTIFAAGGAARLDIPSARAGIPKTGYLAVAMAKRAARSLAAAIHGEVPSGRPLPRLLDARILDGGDVGVLLVCLNLGRPFRVAMRLPGRVAHAAKVLLLRYVLWKLRTGQTTLP